MQHSIGGLGKWLSLFPSRSQASPTNCRFQQEFPLNPSATIWVNKAQGSDRKNNKNPTWKNLQDPEFVA